MSDEANSIKKLRQFYKDRTILVDIAAVHAELLNASDRSIVITLGAFLDDVLTYLIAKHIRPQKTKSDFDDAFRFEGPLGTFSARIEIAYLFKLVDDVVYRQLHDIRELRNACAHSKRPIFFSTPELANVCKRILHPKGSFKLRGNSPADLKSAFTAECLHLHGILQWGRDDATRRLKESYERAGMIPPFDC
jgi:hypothetical protein